MPTHVEMSSTITLEQQGRVRTILLLTFELYYPISVATFCSGQGECLWSLSLLSVSPVRHPLNFSQWRSSKPQGSKP